MQYVLAPMIDLHTELKNTSSYCLLHIFQNQNKIFKKNSKVFHLFDLYFRNFRCQKRFMYLKCLLPHIILGRDINLLEPEIFF